MWKCKKCGVENQDEVSACSDCGEEKTTEASTGAAEPIMHTWHYSGKALRGFCLLTWLWTIVLLAIGGLWTWQGWTPNSQSVVWGVLIVLGLLAWAYFFCVYWYRTQTISYRLTDHRFEYIQGIFTRSTDPMELLYIDDVKLEIRLWDRIVNGGVGTIILFSKVDKTDSELRVEGLENPEDVYHVIDTARAKARAKRGFIST